MLRILPLGWLSFSKSAGLSDEIAGVILMINCAQPGFGHWALLFQRIRNSRRKSHSGGDSFFCPNMTTVGTVFWYRKSFINECNLFRCNHRAWRHEDVFRQASNRWGATCFALLQATAGT